MVLNSANSKKMNLQERQDKKLLKSQQEQDLKTQQLAIAMRNRCRLHGISFHVPCPLSNAMHKRSWDHDKQIHKISNVKDGTIHFYDRNRFTDGAIEHSREAEILGEEYTAILNNLDIYFNPNNHLDEMFGEIEEYNSDEEVDFDFDASSLKTKWNKMDCICFRVAEDEINDDLRFDEDTTSSNEGTAYNDIHLGNSVWRPFDVVNKTSVFHFAYRHIRWTVSIRSPVPAMDAVNPTTSAAIHQFRFTWKYPHLYKIGHKVQNGRILLFCKLAVAPKCERKVGKHWIVEHPLPQQVTYLEEQGSVVLVLDPEIYSEEEVKLMITRHQYITWHHRVTAEEFAALPAQFAETETLKAANAFVEQHCPLLCNHEMMAQKINKQFTVVVAVLVFLPWR